LTELVKYEAARRALAEAVSVDEVMSIHDRAEAMRYAAKIAGDKTLEIHAAQIRFRAQRRFGEMMAEQHAAGKVAKGGRPRSEKTSDELSEVSADELPPITLRDLGVTHRFSSQAQRLAELPAEEFEALTERHAEEMRSGKGRVAMDLLKVGAEERGREHRRNLAGALAAQSAELPSGPLVPAVYLDPPWRRQGGIGDRAYENHYPTMTWPEILAYLRQARDRLLPDAWAFMWIPRPHLLALVEVETEVTIAETGEVTQARVDMPLSWACGQALGMDSYSTCFVWTKTDADFPDDSGSGLIAWDQDELLLLFKRGQGLPKPSGAEKFGSNHRERPREHSRKPDFYRHMIATMVGCDAEGRPLPVLELFARVDAEHPLPPGWLAAGNQAAPMAELEAECPECGADVDLEAHSQDCTGSWQQHRQDNESSFAAGVPSDAGETEAAAADATSDGASAAAAVAETVPDPAGRAPYDAGDASVVDQLAASDFLAPAELDALELEEIDQLRILSDFCHPKRDATQNVLGPIWAAREMAYQSGGQWQLREAGKARLRALVDAAAAPPAPVALTEPYRSPQPSLFDCPAPEIVDGVLQTRLPVDDDELAEQLALMAVDAGGTIDGEMARHLCGKDYLHATTKALKITELGRAFLAQLVGPASVQQQQGATS
jgi:N6-adenosine-specific RNA methylase IME4